MKTQKFLVSFFESREFLAESFWGQFDREFECVKTSGL